MAFFDMMGLILVYTSLDQNFTRRHYKEQQKHQEDGDNVKFYTMKDLKNSHDFNDVIFNIIKR